MRNGKPEKANMRSIDKGLMARARRGDADAQYVVGQSYMTLKGKPGSATKAVAWFRKAAEQGHEGACYCMGVAYSHGLGVAKNERAALNWFRSLAGDRRAGIGRALEMAGDPDGDMEWVLEATNARRRRVGLDEMSSTVEFVALTAAEAQELVRKEARYSLYLDGLKKLRVGVAEVLAGHRGKLSLNGLKRISEEDAAALGRHRGELWLDGVTVLSDAAAQSLARHAGNLSLRSLVALSDVGIRALRQHMRTSAHWLNDQLVVTRQGNSEQGKQP